MFHFRNLVLTAILTALLNASFGAHGAPTFSFSGSWSQRQKQSSDGTVVTVDTTSSRLKATLPMDVYMIEYGTYLYVRFDPVDFENPTNSQPEIQEISFSVSDDPSWHPGKTSATLVYHDDGTPENPAGWTTTVKLNWTLTSLSIDISSDHVIGGLSDTFLGNKTLGKAKYAASYRVTVQFGGDGLYGWSHVIAFSGSNTGSETSDRGTVLNKGSFSTTADYTPPSLAVISPANGCKTAASPVIFHGTASGKSGIHDIQYLNTAERQYGWGYCDSESPANWSFSIDGPSPGLNVVLVKATDNYGNEIIVTNTFTFLVTNSLSLQVVGIPSAATNLGVVSGLADGQKVVAGQFYTVTATPNKTANAIFLYWVDGAGQILGTDQTLKWLNKGSLQDDPVTLQAYFAFNPYPMIKGSYAGLFLGDEFPAITASSNNVGTIILTVTASGSYSGKITTLSGVYPFSGHLLFLTDDSETGYASGRNFISKANVLIDMKLRPVEGIPTLDGNVYYAVEFGYSGAMIRAQMAPAAVTSNAWAGLYTFKVGDFADPYQPDLGFGNGCGSVTVNKTGLAAMVLNLPDKIPPVSVSPGFLSANYPTIPFFTPLYGNKGFVMGWVDFSVSEDNSPQRMISSQNIIWYKPSNLTKQATYGTGFYALGPLSGLCYEKTNLPATAHGSMTIQGNPDSTLSDPVTADWTYTAAKGFVFTNLSANAKQLKLTLNTTTGVATGSVVVTPTSGPKVTLQLGGTVLTHASGAPEFSGFSVVGNASVNLEMTLSE